MSFCKIPLGDKVTCLTIGDIHFNVKNFAETTEFTNAVYDVVQKTQLDMLVILGDVLHRHELIDVVPLNQAMEFFRKLESLLPQTKIYVLVGNHDRQNNSDFLSDIHPFQTFTKEATNIKIVHRVVEDKVKDRNFLFVPYVPPGKFQEALNTHPTKSEITCIFAHQELYNCPYKQQAQSKDGDKWELGKPLIISGHIHVHCHLQNNIYYPGTPIQHGYMDKDDKGLSLFTFDKDSVDEVRIKLDVTRKRTIHVEAKDLKIFTPEPRTSIKLIVTGTSAEIKAIGVVSIMETLEKLGVKISLRMTTHNITPVDRTMVPTVNRANFKQSLLARLVDHPQKLSRLNEILSRQ